MTIGARIGWESARLVARTGAFYLLPTQRESELADAVRPFVSPGDSLAVAIARRGQRGVVLVMGPNGRLTSAIKVALDADGRQKLAREADWLRRANQLLEPPLSAPHVRESSEGVLVLAAVAWVPRWRPWILPAGLARGIGRLHAALGRLAHPGHGDFAPWNVMRTGRGWVVIDWEEATYESPPYADPFHYVIQAHALLGRPGVDEILRGLKGRGWVGAALGAYAAAAGLTSVDRHQALVQYLRSSMPRDPARSDDMRGQTSRLRLLELLNE